MPTAVVEQLAGLPVRFVRLAGYPGTRAIGRMLDYFEGMPQGAERPDAALLHDRELPWLYGVAGSFAEIDEFAAEVFARAPAVEGK
ncbi:MAG: hypothetical protein AB8H80_21770, partial [Planctomycetota bacterium]